nr:NADH dehydrogenase subunit 5 [Melanonus zugmayeri]
MPPIPLMYTFFLIMTFGVLFQPLFIPYWTDTHKEGLKPKHVKDAVKGALFFSLFILAHYLYSGTETVIATSANFFEGTLDVTLSLTFDHYSIIFLCIALFVTWSIVEFAEWYMHSDPLINLFFEYLLLFLIAMLILVTANNLFQLFVGWEGVGIMSFLLIGWWNGRTDANTAAMQAVLYNRVGDIGMVAGLTWTATRLGTWDIPQVCALTQGLEMMIVPAGLIVAATGKSAQFGLHPWLPAAMEGPTPVSALLHSSTMVVAGIFLLIRLNPLINESQMALTLCLWLGTMTAIFSAVCALTQNDIKKIIAFSTSSQLGLMMVTIGLNQPQLAFIHICTHAFFKAMLFLCAGSMIHALNDEQDIRKMGGLFRIMPLTASCFTVGNLALAGAPFMAGFYSKDAIIECFNTSYVNSWALGLILLATVFTAVYSLRSIFYVTMGLPRFPSLSPINENNRKVLFPLLRLALMSIFGGLYIIININLVKTPVLTMPMLLKVSALAVAIVGLLVALEVAVQAHKKPTIGPTSSPRSFSTLLGFFTLIIHRISPKLSLKWAQKISHLMVDQSWLEKTGPKAITKASITLATSTSNMQRGLVKTYFILFFLNLILMAVVALIAYKSNCP